MIIGNGMIGKKLQDIDRDDILFFASGVSDSSCKKIDDYNREIQLLTDVINTDKKIIYFSSIDEYLTNSYYLEHKIKIENIIQNSTSNFIILKLPQLIGKDGNSKNFIHFLYDSIKNNKLFDLYNTVRSLFDIDDMINILKILIDEDYTGFFNINYIELKSVKEFVKILEDILNKKSLISNIIETETQIKDNTELVENIINRVINNRIDYNEKIIKKYKNGK